MDFDREWELENAGIDAFDFSLMDDDERAEVLQDAGLDPEDYDGIEFDSGFEAWRDLQDAGLSLGDVEYMDERERRETLDEAGLSIDDYEAVPQAILPNRSTPMIPDEKPVHSQEREGAGLSKENRPAPTTTPVSQRPYVVPDPPVPPAEKKKKHPVLVTIAVVIPMLLFIGLVRQLMTPQKPVVVSTYRASDSGYSYSSYTPKPSIPTCLPLNREKAMTKEEAEKLRGTGYHNTRPNSSAENTELAAAQTKCRNCGYRTHNGANSLCDYCSWMERYGGGLPKVVNPTSTPAPTPRHTNRPKSGESNSDPYNAKSYPHPDDFYYDHYDDFWDYEEAEEYWETHQ